MTNNSIKNVFNDARHTLISTKHVPAQKEVEEWRPPRMRLKTIHLALILCLNVGFERPEYGYIEKLPKMECWYTPSAMEQSNSARSKISQNLKDQYLKWQPRARIKITEDPTKEDINKCLTHLRRSARNDRVLFHYNGHGVPSPTKKGVLWVNNAKATKYEKLEIKQVKEWIQTPAVYVFDCNAASIVRKAILPAKVLKKTTSMEEIQDSAMHENILLCACSENEILPMNPNLPADVFTSCLTTPIEMAIFYYMQNSKLSAKNITYQDIPGTANDRRTPKGELSWIFTAVTDTIAWSVLPRKLFHCIFRRDVLLASLFRNYLLANRVLRSYNCTPYSYPQLPDTHNHPLWASWDLTVEMCLSHLSKQKLCPTLKYEPTDFFSAQLADFEVWLKFDSSSREKREPKQLPIILQVLLSQSHRLQALELLSEFLDLGSWAIATALSVGIFGYVLRLLKSLSPELRPVLTHIWVMIISHDTTMQHELIKDKGHDYFFNILNCTGKEAHLISKKMRCEALFILCCMVEKNPKGQQECRDLLESARAVMEELEYVRPIKENDVSSIEHDLTRVYRNQTQIDCMLRQWLCLAMSHIIPIDRIQAQSAYYVCLQLIRDNSPEVRASAVYTLGMFALKQEEDQLVNVTPDTDDSQTYPILVIICREGLFPMVGDCCVLVRRELCHVFFNVLYAYRSLIPQDYLEEYLRLRETRNTSGWHPDKTKWFVEHMGVNTDDAYENLVKDTIRALSILALDPMKTVRELADHIMKKIYTITFGPLTDIEASVTPPNPTRSPTKKRFLFKSDPTHNMISEEFMFSNFYSWCKEQFVEQLHELKEKELISSNKDVLPNRAPALNRTRKRIQQLRSTKVQGFSKRAASIQLKHDIVKIKFSAIMENKMLIADSNNNLNWYNFDTTNNTTDLMWCTMTQSSLHGSITDFTFLSDANGYWADFGREVIAVASDAGYVSIYDIRNKPYFTTYPEKSRSRTSDMLDFDSTNQTKRVRRPKLCKPISAFSITGKLPLTQHRTVLTYTFPKLIVGGDYDMISMYDLERESCIHVAPTKNQAVMSLSSFGYNSYAAGCGDGSIIYVDSRRKDPVFSTEHESHIVELSILSDREMYSCDSNGVVKFWDLRMMGSEDNSKAISQQFCVLKPRDSAVASVMHPFAPCFVVASDTPRIQLFSREGQSLSSLTHYDSYVSQRFSQITAIDFHPYHTVFALGCKDRILSIYV
mmetsp:Transcript_8724/g.12898  ORF Transcript_8724/g.12898 Transcript_8724/m.12898 type:complete len:1221 (+) Transcript_8724:170-3832(+)